MSPAADEATRGAIARSDRELFNRISRSYAQKDLSRASRPARRQRLLHSLRHASLPRDCRLLEVGCGAGFAAGYLAGAYGEYVGIDHSEELIGFARAHNAGPGVSFRVADVNEFQDDQGFDAILMVGVLHHLEDIDASMRRMVGLLRPGGWLIANEPHPGNPLVSAARAVRTRVDANYSPDQVELSSEELMTHYRRAGLRDARVVPQGLLSTPFAEVALRPEALMAVAARLACAADSLLERLPRALLERLTWNLVACGRRP